MPKSNRNIGPLKHGHASGGRTSPEYTAWMHMIQRCRNPNCKHFSYYGGRGITVCERWRNFENFFRDMGPRPTAKHTLERVDNNGNYTPENCVWATRQQQQQNIRSNQWIEWRGQRRVVAEWARIVGIQANVLGLRFKNGWTPERALTTPIKQSGQIQWNGENKSVIEWAREYGLTDSTLRNRLQRGWSMDKALHTKRRIVHR